MVYKEKSLSDLTQDIVLARAHYKNTFAGYKTELDHINESLRFVTNLEFNPLWLEIVSEDSNGIDLWEKILKESKRIKKNLDSFISLEGDFTIAKSRADRDYVNIGSVGIMREGKSEFVAQTTKLDKWILPRKKGEHACTTTSINVINGASDDGKSEITRVYYYTIKEMVSLFGDYLEEFNLERTLISDKIFTRKDLEEWCKEKADYLEENITSSQSKLKKKFMEYLNNIDKYSMRLIEGENPENNKDAKFYQDYLIAEIKEGEKMGKEYYSSVSYYTTPDSKPGEEVFTSFATCKAEIYTKFDVDNEYVENIQFLDTPGIGEKKVGVDRILSDAVAMNLDVIIAIRALNGNAKEDQEQTFVNILRNRLNGKDSASEWVYYLLNIWDGQDYEVAQNCIDDLNYLLTTGSDSASLALDEEHFRVINLHDGYQKKSNNSEDSNNPIGKYLKHILSNLIPKIEEIDKDFFKKAQDEYETIVTDYNNFVKSAKELYLPSYNDYGRIQKLIETLQLELKKENAKNPDIMKSIVHTVDEFCHQETGVLVGRLFGIDNVSKHTPERFFDAYKDNIQVKYDQGSYNSNYDFLTYSNLKESLMQIIEDDIYGRINQDEADRLLNETRDTIAGVFINSGKMGFITHDQKAWLSKAVSLLATEKRYPRLLKIISSFSGYVIDARKIIQTRVETVVTRSVHQDNFGDPDDYDFQSYDNASMAITNSLFNIEEYAKGLINDGLIRDELEQQQINFNKIYYRLTKWAASTEPNLQNEIKDELYNFYESHSTEVFKDDKILQKRGLVTSWINNFK